jgi:FKBP-type peptidyl-prolyl cis-trans isomerase FkpA
MYRFLFALILFAAFVVSDVFSADVKLTKREDSAAYSVGFNVGKTILSQIQYDSLPFNIKHVLSGIEDGLLQKKPAIAEDKVQQFVMELQKQISEKRQKEQERREKELQKQGEENLKKAQNFLEENKKKEDINVTQSGLQYKVLKLGTGKRPVATSTVKVHYKGTLLDGTVFDDSYSRGNQPAEFALDKVIRGFQEGLMLMSEGSKFILYIPPDIGYGNRAVGKIPPNSLLIFEVELFEVKDQ